MAEVGFNSSFLELLIRTVRMAGQILLKNFRKRPSNFIIKSGKANFRTEVDLLIENFLRQQLTSMFPDVPVFGEETENKNGNGVQQEDLYFLVDPLDGTLNYLCGLPIFCVALALLHRGQPQIGVVYAPALKEMFWAVRGHGAFCNGQKIIVHKSRPISQALVATGWPYQVEAQFWAEKALARVQRAVGETRILGSAALAMCYVAASVLDVYWEIGLEPWDIAAGWLIVEEAGGWVSDVNGDKFNLLSGRVLAATEKKIGEEIVRLLQRI